MAGSTRAELSSSSLDASNFGAGYPNGQRGTYSISNLDRSGSFRESIENRMLVSGTGSSRSAATPSVEIPPVTQYLPLEPFFTNDLKNPRSGELRRVLGVSVEDHSFGSSQSKPLLPISLEELKRFRGSVMESSNKAKNRAKLLHDSAQKVDKFCNIVTRKRQRNEMQPSEKSGSSNPLKMGNQVHQSPSDLVSQRLEERTKNNVPNRRVRSSMAEASSPSLLQSEGRGTVTMRQGTNLDKDKSIPLDKDKNMLRTCNGGPIPSDDKIRGLPAGGDGWEKKLKRKRSVCNMVNRTVDGDRELKQPIQQRPNSEPRQRSSEGLGFRVGSSNGIIGSNKSDGSPQLSGNSSRIMPRNDLDSSSLSNERRERCTGLDKERIISKGSNKVNNREDAQVGNQSPLTKGKASRAPRTGSGVMMSTPRSSGGIDGWEQPSSLAKVQASTGAINRKRPLPTGSSSPPVAQWVGQRPQKISRTRRANVVSPVSNFDDAQAVSEGFAAPDIGCRITSMESSGILLSRGIPNNTHQLKLKLENVPSPAGFSESEESGVLENKSKEKGVDNGETDDGTMNAANKVATFVLPTKKNKVPLREEIGDGVRRQGRSGRGSTQSRASLPFTKEKLENIEATKPLKFGRPISDKTESRIGRPPSKKVSDRKGSSRPGKVMNSSSLELAGESDDDREELLAAANAARSAICLASSSSFWKKMGPMFAFVSSEDLTFVKHQTNFAEELGESLSNMPDADYNGEAMCGAMASSHVEQVSQTNMVRLNNSAVTMCSVAEAQTVKISSGKTETKKWFENIIPLSQRLLSALITEDEAEKFECNIKEGDAFLQFSSDFSPYGGNSCVENGHKADLMKSKIELDHDMKSRTNSYGDDILCNGSAMHSSFKGPNSFIFGDELLYENDVLIRPHAGALSDLRRTNTTQLETLGADLSGTSPYECQFEHMSLDDKILLELHSIGIYPETVPDLAEGDDEEIDKVVSELKIKLYQEVRTKKKQLCKLEKALQEEKECAERNLEQLAMYKLVEMAYKRLHGGRGSSHKSGASKVSKQLALAFAKRTLARCRKYEETGQSCFREPILRDLIFSAPLPSIDAKYADGSAGPAHNVYVESRNCPFGSRVSASGVTLNMNERNGPGHKIGRSQLDQFQGLTHMSEQTFVRNDPISGRGKKREVLLDDVVTSTASRATSTVSNTLPVGAKWKKTDKDRDQNKDTLTRNAAPKAGRPSLSTGRGERKPKAKPKQKIAQLSTSGNGLGRVTETTNCGLPSMRDSCETVNSGSTKVNPDANFPCSGSTAQDLSKEIEDAIFPNLPLQGIDSIDELDVADGLGGQGQDIGSWLNVDEDALQDNDLVGLEIPMDDLSDLKLNF